jgi:hypothetical protein
VEPRCSPQGAEVGGERERVPALPVDEGLDPEPVAREDEAAPPNVPDRDREHPPQALGEVDADLLIQVRQHLGVAARAKAVPGGLELAAQLAEVEYLAVLDHQHVPGLVAQRLVAVLEVDDRQPARGHADGPGDREAPAVGPAMDHRRRHRLERGAMDLGARSV